MEDDLMRYRLLFFLMPFYVSCSFAQQNLSNTLNGEWCLNTSSFYMREGAFGTAVIMRPHDICSVLKVTYSNTNAGGGIFIEKKVLHDPKHQLSSIQYKNSKGQVIGQDAGLFVYRIDNRILHVTMVDTADESISRLKMKDEMLIGTSEEVAADNGSLETYVGSSNYIQTTNKIPGNFVDSWKKLHAQSHN